MKILIVEDEKKLAGAILKLMEKNGFSADAVYNGEDGLDYAMSGIYDIILLDILLPKKSGGDVLKELRKSNIHTPVIMLTALDDACVETLSLGADDYIQKPYRADELIARIKAVLRRNSKISDVESLTFGDIELQKFQLKLKCKNSFVSVTKKEAAMLEYFILNKGIVVTKEQIIDKLWGFDSDAEANHVEVYVFFLRKKLKFLKSSVEIRTVRSVGYSLITTEDQNA